MKGENALFVLKELTSNNHQIIADYNWGLNESDMGHIFDLSVNLNNLQIEVVHCL